MPPGGQRGAAVAVLAIVIILDDPALRALGPGQQLQTTRQTHDYPCRVLMRGRDVGQPAITEPGQLAAVDALAIHGDPVQPRTGDGECMTRRAISRILNRHPVARLHQQLCTKADPLLRTTGDHYLLSGALHASRTAQVGCDQPA